MYWSSTLKVLGRQNEPYVGIGWGGDGEDVLVMRWSRHRPLKV